MRKLSPIWKTMMKPWLTHSFLEAPHGPTHSNYTIPQLDPIRFPLKTWWSNCPPVLGNSDSTSNNDMLTVSTWMHQYLWILTHICGYLFKSLFIYIYTHIFVYLYIHIFVYLYIDIFVYFLCFYICRFLYWYIFISIYLYIYFFFIFIFLYVYIFLYLYIYIFIYIFIYLNIFIFI